MNDQEIVCKCPSHKFVNYAFWIEYQENPDTEIMGFHILEKMVNLR